MSIFSKNKNKDSRPVSNLNRKDRRAEAFRKRTKEEIAKGIYPERVFARGIQDSSEVKYKQVFVKTTRKSRAGVKYTVYKKLIVKK